MKCFSSDDKEIAANISGNQSEPEDSSKKKKKKKKSDKKKVGLRVLTP